MIWAAKYIAFILLNGVLVVRKLSFLRSLPIVEGEEPSAVDNAERLFAIVGLSIASVTKLLTIALVFVFAKTDVKKQLENVRIGVFCWAFLSALSTGWITIEALYRSMATKAVDAEIEVEGEITTTLAPDMSTEATSEEDEAVMAARELNLERLKKEVIFSWFIALLYGGLFFCCVFMLIKKLRALNDEIKEQPEKEEEFDEPFEHEMEFGQNQFLPVQEKINSLWHRSGNDSGFNSSSASPSTSISTISSCGGKGSSGNDPRRYTDIEENEEMTNSYKSGSMPYPTGPYPAGGPQHRYNELDESAPWQKVQMNQQLTKEHLMARCTGMLEAVDTLDRAAPKITPGLSTLLRHGGKTEGKIKKYEDSRQYELRKSLPRNFQELQTAKMRIEKRPPSKNTNAKPLQWNDIPSYTDIDANLKPENSGDFNSKTENGRSMDDSSYKSDDTKESIKISTQNGEKRKELPTAQEKIPKVLSDQLERAFHLDRKLSKVLEQAESVMNATEKATPRTDSLRRSRPGFRSVPIPRNDEPEERTLPTQPAEVSRLPELNLANVTGTLPKSTPGLPPINNFRPNSDENNNFQPPIPARNHPAHYKSGDKEFIQLGSKSGTMEMPTDKDIAQRLISKTQGTVERESKLRASSQSSSKSNSSSSIDGSISRSMSFASLNSKDSDFSRNSLKRSSLKSASLSSRKKSVRWGTFQEEFTPYEVEGLSKKRNTLIKFPETSK